MPIGLQLLPERANQRVERPVREPLYRVYILNDDVTPMDFVIHILVAIFTVPALNAAQIMLAAHLNGKAYVATLPGAEARRRIGKARFAARMRNFPLDFSMEVD